DELERQRALERKRAQFDAASLAADAKMARQLGFDEGREQGIEKGKLIGRIQLLQQFLGQPETPNQDLDRQPEQDLLRMEESLKTQLASKKQANGPPPTDKPNQG